MRKILAVGVFLAFVFLIPAADLWAAPLTDVFTLTGTWAGTTGSQPFAAPPFTLSFTAPASPTPFSFGVDAFNISVNGSYTNNGTTTLFSIGTAQFDAAGGFSFPSLFDLFTPTDGFLIEALTPPDPLLFLGATSSPTFIPGTYALTGFGQYFPPVALSVIEAYSGTLTIAPVVTPEPSSLILLGSGLLGVWGAARRKVRG